MTPKAREVIHAAREVAKMKTPSVPEILSKRGFAYEAQKIADLITAIDHFDQQAAPASDRSNT
ncbi:hypothetical protein [Geminisphaera colitermitum]|uniref:hypothetical protein n=1 Tax=Geminisphaera colitermitum TaxID=1148786 RepID=UPI0012FE8E9B|nr:hypothetical protein [Geminisphaera colitermitum]